jgi:uncharacterized membrane protein YhiD involved in acid resistance
MNNPLTDFYNLAQTESFGAAVILFNILFAFVLSMAVMWVWRRTHRGLSYSQSFAFTIVMLAPLAATVMMVVQNNLVGAFALLGAFAFIRFRTIIKETRDVAFLFFSLTVGVAAGTSNYALGFISTIVISLVILWLNRINLGAGEKTGFVLTLETADAFSPEKLNDLFAKYLRFHELLHAKRGNGNAEYAYSLHFKRSQDTHGFMGELKSIPNISHSYLITGKELIEY